MKSITSVPHLFAVATGADCTGPHRCFYCGAPCKDKHPASTYVKSSFTGRAGVVAPGSPWVCRGCVLCLRESTELTLVDGEKRDGQRVRGYTWLLTRSRAVAMTKTHTAAIRNLCLSPPRPPYALVITDSGQTHQLYRGRVNHASDPVTVSLEAEPITYHPAALAELLPVAARVAAATGKPCLSQPLTPTSGMRVLERYRDGEAIVDQWTRHGSTGIGRLAAWLTPRKEDSANEYPSDLETESP
jgi:hypothetical protein